MLFKVIIVSIAFHCVLLQVLYFQTIKGTSLSAKKIEVVIKTKDKIKGPKKRSTKKSKNAVNVQFRPQFKVGVSLSPSLNLNFKGKANLSKKNKAEKYYEIFHNNTFQQSVETIPIHLHIFNQIDSHLDYPKPLLEKGNNVVIVKARLYANGRLKQVDAIFGEVSARGYILGVLSKSLKKGFLKTNSKKEYWLIFVFKFLDLDPYVQNEETMVFKNQLMFNRYRSDQWLLQAQKVQSAKKDTPGVGLGIDLIALYEQFKSPPKKGMYDHQKMKDDFLYALTEYKKACDRQSAYGACAKASQYFNVLGQESKATKYKNKACLYGYNKYCD